MQVIEAKGFRIPIVGLGTWALRGHDCARLTEQAIRIGYRHIDTAQMYENEREVGEGVRASGLRAEVMVTTKVPADVAVAARPRAIGQGKPRQITARRHRSAADPLAQPARAAVRDARRHGQDETRRLCAGAGRVEFHRGAARRSDEGRCPTSGLQPDRVSSRSSNQDKVVAACRRLGMALVAYSPIARGGSRWRQGAGAHRQDARQNRSTGQLRWLVQQGVVVIPRTSKIERLEENLAICSTSNCRTPK